MRNTKINPIIGVVIILITTLISYGIYRELAILNDEAFFRGFNAGAQTQKMLDDQRRDLEDQIEKNKAKKNEDPALKLSNPNPKLKL